MSVRGGPPWTPADAGTLDHAAWASLRGPHARFAESIGHAARYPPEVSPFAAVAPDADAGWADLARLVGAGGTLALAGEDRPLPAGWEVLWEGVGLQMVDTGLRAEPDDAAVVLTAADVPEMLDLIDRTRPGPFLERTIELGAYIGFRREGALVAMAGERLRPPGWTEISAVCTDPAVQGQGLAARLIRALVVGVRARGDTAFLHVVRTNVNAIRLYEWMGFATRREVTFQSVRAPG
jgi:ribosomal protein S18 acetylase RimI-like enzyme